MKTRLTLTVAALLLAAMLLINLALLALWKRDILHREAAHDQAVLIHIAYRRRAEKARPQEYVAELPHGGLTAVLLRDEHRAADMPPLLAEAAAESMGTGEAAVCSTAFFAELLRGRQPFLASALPLRQEGQVIGAAAMIRPLPQLFAPLWQAEKIVLIYIVINLLALAAVFFFRLNSLVVRPVERLAALAGQHSGGGAVWFAADSGSEFNRLAGSLNRMLARIENDRAILQKTVAELEAANRQLHERQAELIRAEKLAAAGRLAAGLAHEIGNPLAVIQGYLDLLARSGQNEENSDFIRRAAQETQRVTRLVHQLLDCTKISKGKPEDIALHTLLTEVAELVQAQKAFQQIKLTVRAEAAQDTVHADPDQLRQVLLNCLLNSADAIGSAGRTDGGAITLATDQPKPGLLRLRIEDNGIGVSAAQLAVVFDPFFTTKEPGRGTGLGLSVSRSIVESVGGFMTMESRAGQGSTVIIRLPLAKGGGGNG